MCSFSSFGRPMGSLGRSPSGLDLTIGVPGSTSSSSSSPVWSGRFSFLAGGGGSMRDLDINQPAYGGEEEFPMGSVEEEEEEGGTPRPKKLRLSKEQSRLLEESFRQHHTLNPKQKEALAMKLELRPRQVEVWFQNRRASTTCVVVQDEAEADGDGVRVPEAVLRVADGGEPPSAPGGGGAAGASGGSAHRALPPHPPAAAGLVLDHVPPVRAGDRGAVAGWAPPVPPPRPPAFRRTRGWLTEIVPDRLCTSEKHRAGVFHLNISTLLCFVVF
ncbi:hypothetical protein GW17_00048943 [Ensete ventricosum]|nr:hypothetical protein GW17_00048943 [Ensete ventricosum]